MSKKLISLITMLAMLLALVPSGTVFAELSADQTGTGGLVLDTNPKGGYEGDYVLIYNPSTSAYISYSTGDMTGLIETSSDPYASVQNGVDSDEPARIDVDGLIAEIDAQRPKIEPPVSERLSFEVGDTRNFTISNYSPGPSSLTFKCVAKGDHCYVWTPAQNLDNYYALDAIDPTYPQLVCDEFESKFDQMNSSFGDHANGSQGDGRINLMYYNIDDGWNINVTTGYVAGYFSSYDYSSNGMPMIHVDTYPCVYYVNAQGEERYRLSNSFSVFCHEYQHLINYSQTGGMDTWLNECMSAAAEEICYPGSSIVSRIQSWENYYYSDNDDWLTPPHEFDYTPAYELHNGFSMYSWSNYLDYVLPLYSQVSMFAQYLFTHYGNTIFRSITQNYNSFGDCVSAISNATGADTVQLVKNFRIAVTANDYAAYDGEYGFVPQEGYDPENYHGVQNPYDLLSPIIFTGSSCSIDGGGAITVKPIGGVYNPPADASSSLQYVGITRNIASEPVSLEGIALEPAVIDAYTGIVASVRIARTPFNANDYDAVWSVSDPSIVSIVGTNRSASLLGLTEGTATLTCVATDRQSQNVYTASAVINVRHYPTLDEALNVTGGTLAFTATEPYPWVVDPDFEGRICAVSTNVNAANSISALFTTVYMEAGETFSFEWGVSSESNYDKLKFLVNGSEVTNISGSVDFTTYTYTASVSRSYTFRWSYEKDYSVNNGRDMAYLDNVRYSGDPGFDVLMGDVNFDGIVDSLDALMILRYALGIMEFTDEQLIRADVSGDGNVLSDDALLVLRAALSQQ